MIAVTIGVGPYYERVAKISAAFLKENTGIDSVIFTTRDFIDSGLRHPAALKLRIFKILCEDDILYHDADWFCINQWRPIIIRREDQLLACRDFIFRKDWPLQQYSSSDQEFLGDIEGRSYFHDGELREDYIQEVRSFAQVRLKPDKWINTGFFIASRKRHALWLDEAERIYQSPNGHHPKYFEQPAMLKALESCDIGVDFLARRFNILVSRMSKWPQAAVGLHLKLSKRLEFENVIFQIERGNATLETIRALFLE